MPRTLRQPLRAILAGVFFTAGSAPRAQQPNAVDTDPWRLMNSWGGRIRTCNFLSNSQAVCQLTYTPS
jgi:hypothetical protein